MPIKTHPPLDPPGAAEREGDDVECGDVKRYAVRLLDNYPGFEILRAKECDVLDWRSVYRLSKHQKRKLSRGRIRPRKADEDHFAEGTEGRPPRCAGPMRLWSALRRLMSAVLG